MFLLYIFFPVFRCCFFVIVVWKWRMTDIKGLLHCHTSSACEKAGEEGNCCPALTGLCTWKIKYVDFTAHFWNERVKLLDNSTLHLPPYSRECVIDYHTDSQCVNMNSCSSEGTGLFCKTHSSHQVLTQPSNTRLNDEGQSSMVLSQYE